MITLVLVFQIDRVDIHINVLNRNSCLLSNYGSVLGFRITKKKVGITKNEVGITKIKYDIFENKA
jgi:hypothetical protein